MPDPTLDQTRKARAYDADLFLKYGIGHLIPNYEKVITRGLYGMRAEAHKKDKGI